MPGSFLIGRGPNGSDIPVRVDQDGNFLIEIAGDIQVDADLGALEAGVAAIDAKLPVLVDGSQPVAPVGVADLGNTTTTNLNGGASFVGTGIEVSPRYGTVSVCIISSHNSATNGLKFQASIDNINWENIEQYNYVAANGLKSYSFSPSGKYFRVNYTNGATATTKLAIFTVLRTGAVKASSHRVKDNIDGEHDAELVKAVLAAEMPSGAFTDINATADGNLKISLEEVNGIDPIPVVTGLEIPPHDYIGMTYTGSNLTGVTYKTGGSGGTTVATLTLAYDGNNNLTSVARS